MRAVLRLVVLALMTLGCWPVSIQPVYHENQLISFPGLDGVWRDSSDGTEIVLSAVDSLTYLMSVVEGEDAGEMATSYLTLRLARRNNVTFVDVDPSSDKNEETAQPFLFWHAMSVHGFALTEVEKDRVALHWIDMDTLTALLKRSPREIAHLTDGDRMVLTAPTEQVQSFLIRTSLLPGKTTKAVYRRVPASSSCDESDDERLSVGRNITDSRMLQTFSVDLHRAADVAVVTLGIRPTGAFLLSDALSALIDSAGSSASGVRLTLSQYTPLVVVTDQKNERRLELRWIGVEPDGDLGVRAVECHDMFPSSQEARATLTAPAVLVTQLEGDSISRRRRYTWSRVPGATAYEVQRVGLDHGRVEISDRFVVQDTSIVPSQEIAYTHRWRVRAYTTGVGFGSFSTIEVAQRR